VRQATRLGRRVARQRPDLVITSPRRRARETAHVLVAEARCPLQLAPALDEIDFGAWSGQSFAMLARNPHWRRWNAERADTRTPAGDSMLAAQTRIVEFLHELALAHAGATLALVSHAEPVRCALLRALGMPLDDWRRIEIGAASLSALRISVEGLRADFVNEQVAFDERLSA
jgi:probable phosphoglycerate mutase